MEEEADMARLHARPGQPTEAQPTGLQVLQLDGARDALLYVPPDYRHERPAPFALMLHGAGGDARGGMGLLHPLADAHGLILLAPASLGRTWDVILHDYGSDVALIDQTLAWVFKHYTVDPARLAIGGFSDGASYALSLALSNGDLFTHALAFSPGFAAPAEPHGQPRLFLSHGARDGVLPIDRCSRRLVPWFEHNGYSVTYREFDGPHTVPPEIAAEGVDWFLNHS
jgi:predicted esterase